MGGLRNQSRDLLRGGADSIYLGFQRELTTAECPTRNAKRNPASRNQVVIRCSAKWWTQTVNPFTKKRSSSHLRTLLISTIHLRFLTRWMTPSWSKIFTTTTVIFSSELRHRGIMWRFHSSIPSWMPYLWCTINNSSIPSTTHHVSFNKNWQSK